MFLNRSTKIIHVTINRKEMEMPRIKNVPGGWHTESTELSRPRRPYLVTADPPDRCGPREIMPERLSGWTWWNCQNSKVFDPQKGQFHVFQLNASSAPALWLCLAGKAVVCRVLMFSFQPLPSLKQHSPFFSGWLCSEGTMYRNYTVIQKNRKPPKKTGELRD